MNKSALWHKNQERCQINKTTYTHTSKASYYSPCCSWQFFMILIFVAMKFKTVFMRIRQFSLFTGAEYVKLLSSRLLFSSFYSLIGNHSILFL